MANVLTYTGAGGLSLTSAAAGLVSLGQGTAQGLGTTAIGITAPTQRDFVEPATGCGCRFRVHEGVECLEHRLADFRGSGGRKRG